MKRYIFSVLLALICLTGSGCRSEQAKKPIPRTVTQIHVVAAHDTQITNHTFTDYKKMETVLNYLRLLDPYLPAEITPDTFRSNAYEITVSYSDGARTTYRQIYNQYLQTDGGVWKKINPAQGEKLLRILMSMPDDQV